MNFKVLLRLLVGFIYDNNELFLKFLKEALPMVMRLEMSIIGVMWQWLSLLPCVREAQCSYIFQMRTPLRSYPLNRNQLWKFHWMWFTLLSLYLRLFPRSMQTSPAKVSCNLLNLNLMLIHLKEYVILIHDVIWTLLGPYDIITSANGDEDITWHTENNKCYGRH